MAPPDRTAATNGSAALDPALDTFPKLLVRNVERFPDKIAIREKDYGIWQPYTWRQYLEQSRLIALGLAALGFRRGDKTAIVGDNRPQLYWAMLATQALGGVPVPLYQDSIEKEMEFIVDHAEARFAVVEDQEQVDKLLQVQATLPPARAHRLRRRPRAPPLRGRRPHQPGGAPGARAALRARAPRLLRAGGGEGHGGRRRDHLLHVGHDRPAEGDDAVPPEPDRHRPERDRVRGAARDRRGRRLPSHGVDRRPHVLVRAVDPHRLHDQLPGEHDDRAAGPPGDRPDVLLRAARHLPAHPDDGHDPDRRLGAGPSAAWSGSSWTWPGGSSGAVWPGSPCRPGIACSTPSAGCSSTARSATTSG